MRPLGFLTGVVLGSAASIALVLLMVVLTLALAAPFVVAFVALPELIMSALFQRGAFDAAAAARSGAVLSAYAIGLPAAVLIRSAVASFYARSDTMTPLIASLGAVSPEITIERPPASIA